MPSHKIKNIVDELSVNGLFLIILSTVWLTQFAFWKNQINKKGFVYVNVTIV